MRILLTRNLGNDWPERWREGDAVEATEDIGRRLLALGFAVRLADAPPPEPAADDDGGTDEGSTSGGGSPPTAPAAPRPPSRRRGRKKRGDS